MRRLALISIAIATGRFLHLLLSLQPWWPAAWIAPILLLSVAFRFSISETRIFVFAAALFGLSGVFPYYMDVMGGPLRALLLISLQAFGWLGLVLMARRAVVQEGRWYGLFVYPVLWAGLDVLITAVSPHSSWGSLAYSQMDALPVIQIASLTGAPGVVFLPALFASLVSVALFKGRSIPHPILAYGLACGILLGSLGFGWWRISQQSENQMVKVGMVAIDDFIDAPVPPETAAKVWASYNKQITQLAAEGARLVLLPEKIAQFDNQSAEAKLHELAEIAKANKVDLFLGAGQGRANRMWRITAEGHVAEHFDKHHLVPGLEARFLPASEYVETSIGADRYGMAICKDMHFASMGRAYGQRGVQAMLVPAWDFYVDAWMAARMTALRGVESGFTIIRSSREGLLSVSDRTGRFLAERRSAPYPGVSLLAEAPIGPPELTLYARFGDVFGWLCVALIILWRISLFY